MKVLVTGAAGFIGYHVAERLLARGDTVVGLDNLTPYYDVRLKEARLERLRGSNSFRFEKGDISRPQEVMDLFTREKFDRVVHLAAQAGVRHSLEQPFAYVDANITGFLSILEACRHHPVQHLVYASTSSVYGANRVQPFSTSHTVDHPLTLYAATKRANELMAHSYAHLFGIPSTGLRFFTVYGPWGRPDMALFKFTRNILADEPIEVFNGGNHARDFTYVDDIVDGVIRALDHPAMPCPDWAGELPDPAHSAAPFRVFNIGRGNSVPLMDYVAAIEKTLGKKAKVNFLPMQPGDVIATHADVSDLAAETGYSPKVAVEEGVARFVAWYRDYYKV